MVALSSNLDTPRRVANHLYADGPMKVSHEACEGITDLKWFLNAPLSDANMRSLLEKTLLSIFSADLVHSFLADKTEDGQNAQRLALSMLKEFAVLGHYLRSMCQQHFKPRFGVMIDNFIQIINSRRIVSDATLLSH